MMKAPFSGDRLYKVADAPIYLDGKQVDLGTILLTDDAGKGYAYFKLGGLDEKLNFNVAWSQEKGIYIEKT